jgi:hypothetical protein
MFIPLVIVRSAKENPRDNGSKGGSMQTNCPECLFKAKEPDDVACHLMERHGWDYEHARLWLRDQVEEKAANEAA